MTCDKVTSHFAPIWGKVRTAAWDTAPQIALRDCFKESVGGRSICKVLVKVEFNTIESEKKVLISQSCPTLSDPMYRSPSGFSVHGIFQARILEWVAISFSSGSSRPLSTHFTKCFLLVTGSDATMKGFSAFLDKKRWNHWYHKIFFWKHPSKDLSHQIPLSTECLTPFWTPAGGVGMSTAAAYRVQSLQRQMAKNLVYLLANLLESDKLYLTKQSLLIFRI